ncbi:Protein CBG07844 [Caenorhabditis briggsae]|uniref:Protein CBG07844 n=1 Tax=Caenorhabditis briggsae TaxID=6238 RepID=A8X593_CAEBR|nr:Protein CBG07844 [Caenorhabditis briggsae]CAP27792.2 Protein CBG07844 [Caenorhabditis briggsae]
MNNQHDHHQGIGPIDHPEAMNNLLDQNRPWNLENEEEPYNRFHPNPQRQQQHQHQMQQDPRYDLSHHNQFYPDIRREQNQMDNQNHGQQLPNNDKVDQQRDHQNNQIQQQQNRIFPHFQLQENGQQHLNHQNQQRIYEHGQMNQMHQRDQQPQLQLQHNGEQQHLNQHQIHRHGRMNQMHPHQLHPHFVNQQGPQNQPHPHPASQKGRQLNQQHRNLQHHARPNRHHQQSIQIHQTPALLPNQWNHNQQLQQWNKHHMLHPHFQHLNFQQQPPGHGHHQVQRNANRYNPIFNDQARRGRPEGAAMGLQNGFVDHQSAHQMSRQTTPGPMSMLHAPVPQDPIPEGETHTVYLKKTVFSVELQHQHGPVEPEKAEEHKALELVAARQREEIKLLTDANMKLRLEVETINTRRNEERMEFQRKIEKKDGEIEELKSVAFETGQKNQRLEIQNKEFEQRLRRFEEGKFHIYTKKNLRISSSGVNQPMSLGFHQSASSGFHQPLPSAFNLPASSGFIQPTFSGFNQPTDSGFHQPTSSGFNNPTSSGSHQPTLWSAAAPAPMTSAGPKIRPMKIKKEPSDESYRDMIVDESEVKVQKIVRQPKRRIPTTVQMRELPKTGSEALHRWEQEFKNKEVLPARFKIQKFLFDPSTVRVDDNKWDPQVVTKATNPRMFFLNQVVHGCGEIGGWDAVKSSKERKDRWDARWTMLRDEQHLQYAAGLIFFKGDYEFLNQSRNQNSETPSC